MLGGRRRCCLGLVAVLLLVAAAATGADAGVTSAYRRKLEATVDMPMDADVFRVPPGYNAPQQVHITLGDQAGTAMIVSWVTENELGNDTVMYGTSPEKMVVRAQGTHTRYDYFNYTSGFIHHSTLKNLKVRTVQLVLWKAPASSSWPPSLTDTFIISIAPSTTTPWGSATP
jgi:acid phosphatase type 7